MLTLKAFRAGLMASTTIGGFAFLIERKQNADA
jgi:hypothetical protein